VADGAQASQAADRRQEKPQPGLHHGELRPQHRLVALRGGPLCPRTIQAACQWLEDNQDQEKFYLYLDLFDPHEPWDAPDHYLALYERDYHGEEVSYPHYDFWRNFLTAEELAHIRHLYMAEASMVDHWIGVLLEKIDAWASQRTRRSSSPRITAISSASTT